MRCGRHVTYLNLTSPYGHDSFLLEVPLYHRVLRTWFQGINLSVIEP